ncbi:hypothetical protein GCM10007105_16830 [Shewanella chilikensis]|nr:hypothetical protein GCM10007105_16830 [Shewanella chilikensis]
MLKASVFFGVILELALMSHSILMLLLLFPAADLSTFRIAMFRVTVWYSEP